MDLKKRPAQTFYWPKSYKGRDFRSGIRPRERLLFRLPRNALSAEGSGLLAKLFNEILAQLAIQGALAA